MNRKLIYPLVIILVTVVLYYAEDILGERNTSQTEILKETPLSEEIQEISLLPASTTNAIVKHNFFTLSYSEKHEQAEWVAYELKSSDVSNNDFERPYFIEDKSVETGSADWRNYKNSGYDRGHLCPAGDRKFSFEAFNETFLTSNISPQDHDFNAGIWNRLEQKVRFWATKYNGVYVVTGGVLRGDLKTIGTENVAVPHEFYKIVLSVSGGNYKSVAFLIPNKASNASFYEYAVSIDEIEAKTGIDFFPNLPDSVENNLEKTVDLKAWGRK